METNEQENLQDPLFEEPSSHKAFSTTEDSGKYAASKASYAELDSSGVEGDPASSHKAFSTTEDSGKFR